MIIQVTVFGNESDNNNYKFIVIHETRTAKGEYIK